MKRYIDPLKQGTHPLRKVLTLDEWEELDKWVGGDDTVVPEIEHIEAYRDWLFDELVVRVQTHAGTFSLH